MLRRLFNIASVVSLLLCVATVALWVRSYSMNDAIFVSDLRQDGVRIGATVQSAKGRFLIAVTRTGVLYSGPLRRPEFRWMRESKPVSYRTNTWQSNKAVGFGWGKKETDWNKFQEYFVLLPDWSLTSILLLLSLWLARRRLQGSSSSSCQSCDYNLTGNTSGVCPECGTAIKA